MDKIAAYKVALQLVEQEKRAEFIIERFGTCDGQMPEAYLHAFDVHMQKEALLAEAGKAITGAIHRAGRFIGGAGASGSRTGVGGSLMDWSSGLGGRASSGAAKSRQAASGIEDAAEFAKQQEADLKLLGGAGLAAGGLGLAGGGYMLGRPS